MKLWCINAWNKCGFYPGFVCDFCILFALATVYGQRSTSNIQQPMFSKFVVVQTTLCDFVWNKGASSATNSREILNYVIYPNQVSCIFKSNSFKMGAFKINFRWKRTPSQFSCYYTFVVHCREQQTMTLLCTFRTVGHVLVYRERERVKKTRF